MVGIGGERLLVPDLRILVVAHLAVGIADVVGDIGMLVMADRVHRRDTFLVMAIDDQGAGGAIFAQEFRIRFLLMLLLFDRVLGLLLALRGRGIGRRRRIVGAHGIDGPRADERR